MSCVITCGMDPFVGNITSTYKNVAHNDTSYRISKNIVQCVSINAGNIV